MTRPLAAALVLALALPACATPDPPAPAAPALPPPAASRDAPPRPALPDTSRAVPAAPTTSTTTDAPPLDPRSPEAAVEVVRQYYAAIEARDYRRAYALWGDGGRSSGQTFEAFADGFAATEAVRVDAAPATDGDGAAGSVFVTVPVVVHARTTGGQDQTFRGAYVLRRVNDVPGATAAQLRWHLTSADLHANR